MRALIQRVTEASVSISGEVAGAIGRGYVILLGVGEQDTEQTAERLWDKIHKLRIFEDEAGKTNLNLDTVGGSVLVVSQFTLWADLRRGNRPGFTGAGKPEHANALYEYFVQLVRRDVAQVGTGRFGADMQVSLVNDGPFTLWLDTDQL